MHKLPLHPEGAAGCCSAYTIACVCVWGGCCPPGESEELAKFCYLHAGLPQPEKCGGSRAVSACRTAPYRVSEVLLPCLKWVWTSKVWQYMHTVPPKPERGQNSQSIKMSVYSLPREETPGCCCVSMWSCPTQRGCRRSNTWQLHAQGSPTQRARRTRRALPCRHSEQPDPDPAQATDN